MISKKIIFGIVISIFLLITLNITYHYFFPTKTKQPYKTQKPDKRTIKQIIHTTGKLEIKDNVRIGSLITGTIRTLFVVENDKVQKDQLLALIDNGKADSEVKEAQGAFDRAKAGLHYQKSFYKRQTSLHASGQLSQDLFEQYTRDFKQAKADLLSARGTLDKKQIEYNNTRIYAPTDGTIVNVGIAQGERVTTDLDATVLFVIAKDISKMEGKLYIDQSDIGQIKKGQTVKFTVDTYPDKKFKGIITDLSFSAKKRNNNVFYKALVEIDNGTFLLHPGMTLNGEITIAKVKDTLTIVSQMLHIDGNLIKKIAPIIDFEVIPVLSEKKKLLKKENTNYQVKYVWVIDGKQFVEKAVRIDVTDDIHFEVKSGLTGDEDIIVDIEEPDKMAHIYKKWFKGAL